MSLTEDICEDRLVLPCAMDYGAALAAAPGEFRFLAEGGRRLLVEARA